jgi:cobalt-precorrin-5B (C1)-methyltransferase
MADRPLRRGWTTGACAAAAAKAAFAALVDGRFPDPVTIRLPRGETPSFTLKRRALGHGFAMASVIKDAGDDPDITHGAEIVVRVEWAPPGSGIVFRGGSGVGVVTLPGLPIEVDQPAINPGPRAQISDNLNDVRPESDLVVTISIPRGEELATRTMNARLGILGGLSILGTTGVVIPYSCSAWVQSIHSAVDVAKAMGIEEIVATTGKTSETAARRLLSPPDPALIDMGDMAGGLLKYLRRQPVARLVLVGGFAKLAKLAAGHMDLHSKSSEVDCALLASWLADMGAETALVEAAKAATSAAQVLELARDWPLGDRVAKGAREVVLATLAGGTQVQVWVTDRQGRLIGRAG